ncbi:MAG: hypothetical protein M3Q57_08430 [Pseudomonadota bacterium]|nr:hypothetical protein [Pseudomonadota bacterium]
MIAYRSLFAATLVVPLMSCLGSDIPPERTMASDARIAQRLAGKVAGAPVRCLPNHRSNDAEVIDRDTILYRDGSTTYVQNTRGACYPHNGLSSGYILVTRNTGGLGGLCDGDLAHTVQSSTGSFAGSCSFGPFIPYRRP